VGQESTFKFCTERNRRITILLAVLLTILLGRNYKMWAKVTVINQITEPTAMVINMNRIDAVRPRGLNDSDTASELKIGKEWIVVQEDMATIFSPEGTNNV
jgi:hypothetical protein